MNHATYLLMQCFAVIILVISPHCAPPASAGIACHQCHGSSSPPDYRPIDAPDRNIPTGGFPGNHRTHLDASTDATACAKCHQGSDSYTSSHRNGQIDLSSNLNNSPLIAVYRNGSSGFRQTASPRLGSCTNVNCHFERETPTWGSAPLSTPSGCSVCHGAPPAGGDTGAAGSHSRHDAYYTGATGCGQCHSNHLTDAKPFAHATAAGHRPLRMALRNPDGTAAGSYTGPVNDYLPNSQNNLFGRCTAVYCHSDGTSIASGASFANVSTPHWGSGPLACSGCHGYPPSQPKGTGPKANSHGRHSFYGLSCKRCHYGTTNDGSTIADTGKHANRTYDISPPPGEELSYTFSPTGGSCASSYCHSTAQGVSNPTDPPVYRTPSWDMQFANGCAFCHSAGWHDWVASAATGGSHRKHLQFEVGRACNMCHFNPRYVSGGVTIICGQCHVTYFGHRDESARGSEHVNGSIDVAIDPTFPAPGATGIYTGDSVPRTPYGTCESLYCHSQGTRSAPPYEPPNSQPVRWGDAPMPADCTGCHGGDRSSAHPLATGSHQRHQQYDCIRCHAVTVTGNRNAIPFRSGDGVTGYIYTNHRPSKNANGLVEVAFDNRSAAAGGVYAGQATPTAKAPGSAPGRCFNTYCHGDGIAVATGVPFGNISSPIWGSSAAFNCDSCHGYPPSYPDLFPKGNSHQGAHASYGCNSCHYQTTSDGSSITDPARHMNYRYDVAGNPGTTFEYNFAASVSSCANVSCHPPNTPPRSWTSTSCGICHNSAPDTPSHRKHFTGTLLQAVYGNASTTQPYLFNCGSCHPLDKGRDNNGSVEVELYNTAAPADSRKALNPPSATYTSGTTTYQDERGINYTNGSCANIYCHSSGTSVATGGPATSPPITWNGPAAGCGGCHGNPPAYTTGAPKANSHTGHTAFGCATCHSQVTTNGTTISDPLRHIDGRYDVAPSGGSGFGYTFATTGGSCSAIVCHSDGTAISTQATVPASVTATWGGPSLSCTGCHAMPPSYGNLAPKRNSHVKHAPYGCQFCHYNTTSDGATIANPDLHANLKYDVSSAPGSPFTPEVYDHYYTTCYFQGGCHSDGTSVASGKPAPYKSASWGWGTFGCTDCHSNPPAYANGSPKKNSHIIHSGYGCQECHFSVTTTGTTITNPALHTNMAYDVTPGTGRSFTYTFATTGGSCTNSSCHHDGTYVVTGTRAFSVPTVAWGTALGCTGCHGNPPAYPNGTPKKNGHLGNHTFGCQLCHAAVTSDGITITTPAKHGDNLYEVGNASTFTYTFSTSGSTCGSVSCHGDGTSIRTGTARSTTTFTPSWGGTALGCDGCHGNPPAYANYSPKSNSHLGGHTGLGCQVCHYSVTTDGITLTTPANHRNNLYDVAPAPTVAFTASDWGVCTNVSCHSDGTGIATGIPRGSGTSQWGWTSLGCGNCHGNSPNYPNGSPKANSHASHYVGGANCATCHADTTTTGTTITNPAKHKNGVYDLKASGSVTFSYSYSSTGGTCAATSCHGDGTAVSTGVVRNAAPATWGGPSLSCTGCHGYPPAYANNSPKKNSHLQHDAYGCQICHYGTTYNGTYVSTNYHPNNKYEVSAPPSLTLSYTYYASGGSCYTSCHTDGTMVVTGTPRNTSYPYWGGSSLGCTGCHWGAPSYPDGSPKANSHPAHSAYGCKVCHANVVSSDTVISDRTRHGNGSYDVASDGTVTFDYTFSKGGSSCGNISCHTTRPKNTTWSLYAQAPLSYNPAGSATDVPATASVTVQFGEDMDAATITGSTFTLACGASPVAGTVSYDSGTRTASFIPAVQLDLYNIYTATLTTGIRNVNGGALRTSYSWSFTTAKGTNFGPVGTFNSNLSSWAPSGGTMWNFYSWTPPPPPGLAFPYERVDEPYKVDARLQTSEFDMSGYQSAELRFNSYIRLRCFTSLADVDISTNGGNGPWINIWHIYTYYDGYTNSAPVTLNLSSYLKGQSKVAIRFRFSNGTTYNVGATDGYWAVSGIGLYGDLK